MLTDLRSRHAPAAVACLRWHRHPHRDSRGSATSRGRARGPVGDLRGPPLVQGGWASEVGVWIENLNVNSSVGTVEAEPGTRLLVSGEPRWGGDTLDDAIAWPCGFTQPWTEETASEWQTAFLALVADVARTRKRLPRSSARSLLVLPCVYALGTLSADREGRRFCRPDRWIGRRSCCVDLYGYSARSRVGTRQNG